MIGDTRKMRKYIFHSHLFSKKKKNFFSGDEIKLSALPSLVSLIFRIFDTVEKMNFNKSWNMRKVDEKKWKSYIQTRN
jgi:hypothetical protein